MPDAHSPRRPVAVITGASRGIGRAIAISLSQDYHVVALARRREGLEYLEKEIVARGCSCDIHLADVGNEDEVHRALHDVEADVLVNNAGLGRLVPLLELEPDEWRSMIDANVNGLYHVTRTLLPGMVKRGRGHIVVISSIAGRSAFAGGSCYAATKHFANAFAESLYLEVRDAGVKVSLIQPGAVATEFNRGDPTATANAWKLRPDAIASAVRHVLSTGENELVFQMEVRALRKFDSPAR